MGSFWLSKRLTEYILLLLLLLHLRAIHNPLILIVNKLNKRIQKINKLSNNLRNKGTTRAITWEANSVPRNETLPVNLNLHPVRKKNNPSSSSNAGKQQTGAEARYK